MSEQLDYEATKAALRAQSTTSRGKAVGWRWTGATAGAAVVMCAVVVAVWMTREAPQSEVVMVPSAGHPAHPATASTAASPPSNRAPAGAAAMVIDDPALQITSPERLAAEEAATGVAAPEAPAARPATAPSRAAGPGSTFAPPPPVGGRSSRPTVPPTRPAPEPGTSAPATPPAGPAPTNGPTGNPSPPTGGGTTDPGGDTGPSGGETGTGDSTG